MTTNRLGYGMLLGGLAAGLLTFGSAALTSASATERTGINLGTTSFFDGFAGLEPGCTYIQYVGHDTFSSATNSSGNKVADVNLEVSYLVPQVACNSSWKLFGGTLGWNNIVPFSQQNSDSFPTNGTGLGDIVTGPYIQFPPIMRDGHPVFSNGFEFDIIAPTGKYNANAVANPGNDFWSVSPFWKATWLPAHGWEVSWRVNYIHNFDHQTTPNISADGPNLLRNADGVWLNFTASREIYKDLYFGLNGYWLKQLGNDTAVGGKSIANTQQESLYMGPGLHYTLDPKNMFNFNVYLPVYDANALSNGYQVNLQYIHSLD